MSSSQQAVDLFRCPECRSTVVHNGDRLVCTNSESRLAFPIRDGIPVMIVDEAHTLSTTEWEQAIGQMRNRSEV